MKIGLGLPNAVVSSAAEDLVTWSVNAESAGFSCLATIDRLVYPSFETLTALAAASQQTSRIRLLTAILVGPLREPTLLMKQATTIDHLSNGRFDLGIAVGEIVTDFEACGARRSRRGHDLKAMLARFSQEWRSPSSQTAVGPGPFQPNGPPIILGGYAPSIGDRVAKYADGWIGGGMDISLFRNTAAVIRSRWGSAGRAGSPRIMASVFFALGQRAEEKAARYFRDYYGFAGRYRDIAGRGVAAGEADIRKLVSDYQKAGCEQLVLMPCSADSNQLDMLAGLELHDDELGRDAQSSSARSLSPTTLSVDNSTR